MKPATFFGKLKAGAFYNWRTYRVLPSVCAAQAAIESGWGESTLTKNANNLFGMKGSYNGASVTMRTAEYTASGSLYYINAAFRRYPNWNASIVDYANNLRKSGFYPASAFTTTSYQKQINLIGPVYATNHKYAQDVITMIRTYGLDKWDAEAIAGGSGGTFDPSEIGGGDFSDSGSIYKTFQEKYIKENSSTRPKLKLNGIKGIVVHEIKTSATANAFRNTLNSGNQGKKMGYHIIIDGNSAIAVVPLNEGVYHADRTGKRMINGLGNPNNNTISIGVINTNSEEIPTKTLRNLTLAAAEVARIYKLPVENIWGGFMVDGVVEPESWAYNIIAYSAFLAVAESVKTHGESAITNPDYGSGSSGGSNTGLIPGGEGVIKDVIKEALYWEGKLKYSMNYRHQIYPGGYADCSSYTQYVIRKVTKRDIGSNTWGQIASGKSVPISEMRAGDLVFWEKTYPAPPPTHVGLVISGKGPTAKVVHCGSEPSPGGIFITTANSIPGLYGARRIFSDADYDSSQGVGNSSKPNISTKGTYAVQIMSSTNAYNQDIGGYSVKRLPQGEVYKVLEVGTNSLKVSGKVQQSRFSRSMQYLNDSQDSTEMWIPIHSTTIRIAELPTKDSSIGAAIVKIPVKVVDGPSANREQIYSGGKNKVFYSGENIPIYAIENKFGAITPKEDEWINLSSTYVDVSVELESSVGAEIDFGKGQTVETNVLGRSIIYEDGPVMESGVVIKNGVAGYAHKDLLPIGSVIQIDIPTNPSYNRKVVIVSNKIKTKDGNNIEVFFDNELDAYNFGTRKAFITLVDTISIPEGLVDFFGDNTIEVPKNELENEEGGIFFE